MLNLNNKIIVNLLFETKNLRSKEFYKKLDITVNKLIGHKLFTLTVIDESEIFVERVYSNNNKIYPLLGTKPIPKNEWTKKVILKKSDFLGSNFAKIKKLFFDFEIIKSLGCGSIINIPVINEKKILGTLNILHKENFYKKKHIKYVRPLAQLLCPYFITHRANMKKRKKKF
tara:strand:+ start:1421 stop:1936 length:516 start_codon:yes stop_codon:yes gene_type:complete